jgi:RNA polymerase-associated protein RTF1
MLRPRICRYDDEMPTRTPSKGRGGRGRRSSAADDDFEEVADEDDEEDAAEATLDEIQQIRLSRHKLEKWCHEPFFDELVEGCFVRIGIGTNNESSQTVYRCAEIVQVEERQPYTFGETKTRKALKLRHGEQERNFRMEYVSNSKIEPSEVCTQLLVNQTLSHLCKLVKFSWPIAC